MQLTNMSGELRKRYNIRDGIFGAVIIGVDSGSVAAEKKLTAGHVIVQVAQETVSTAAELQKRIDKLKKDGRHTALLQVASPNGETQFVALRLD
jgi:serine protease Do